jgi:hypothetical protein
LEPKIEKQAHYSISESYNPRVSNLEGQNEEVWNAGCVIAAVGSGYGAAMMSPASAVTVVDSISGTFGSGVDNFSGQVTLDVVAGQAISGFGEITFSSLGISNAPMVLITASTPGVETPVVGWRANDGTDLGG